MSHVGAGFAGAHMIPGRAHVGDQGEVRLSNGGLMPLKASPKGVQTPALEYKDRWWSTIELLDLFYVHHRMNGSVSLP